MSHPSIKSDSVIRETRIEVSEIERDSAITEKEETQTCDISETSKEDKDEEKCEENNIHNEEKQKTEGSLKVRKLKKKKRTSKTVSKRSDKNPSSKKLSKTNEIKTIKPKDLPVKALLEKIEESVTLDLFRDYAISSYKAKNPEFELLSALDSKNKNGKDCITERKQSNVSYQ